MLFLRVLFFASIFICCGVASTIKANEPIYIDETSNEDDMNFFVNKVWEEEFSTLYNTGESNEDFINYLMNGVWEEELPTLYNTGESNEENQNLIEPAENREPLSVALHDIRDIEPPQNILHDARKKRFKCDYPECNYKCFEESLLQRHKRKHTKGVKLGRSEPSC